MSRLDNMKEYLEEAKKDPIANRLYIEDLELSIAYFDKKKRSKLEICNGFLLTEEE